MVSNLALVNLLYFPTNFKNTKEFRDCEQPDNSKLFAILSSLTPSLTVLGNSKTSIYTFNVL